MLALVIGLAIGLFTRNRLQAVSAAYPQSLDSSSAAPKSSSTPSRTSAPPSPPSATESSPATPTACIQMMNPVAQELPDGLESRPQGRPLEEVFHIVNETTREAVENPVAKVKRLNRVVGLANHTVLIRKDGSEITIDDSGAPILARPARLTGIVMVFRDVTMERRTRAALLANEKLAVAGRLAATIAHEIHNPLDSVSNLLYLLQHRQRRRRVPPVPGYRRASSPASPRSAAPCSASIANPKRPSTST